MEFSAGRNQHMTGFEPRCSSSGYLVRDGRKIAVLVVQILIEVRLSRSRIKTELAQEREWVRLVCTLVDRLEGPAPVLRVYETVKWYERHWKDPYVPMIESGRALCNKFDRLEAAAQRYFDKLG